MRKQVVVGVSLVVITGLVLGLWGWMSAARKRQAAANTAGMAVPVELRDMSEKIDGTGTVASSQNGSIYPAYEATVQRIVRRAGDTVKKGDLLMVLDSSTLTGEWATASSNVNQAKINLSQAEDELARVETLYKAQGATVDDLASAKKTVALDREELNLARVTLDKLLEKSDGANFYASGQHKLEIRAPFNGKVAWVDVKPGDKVTTETLLLTVTSSQAMEITVDVDESEIGQVKEGQKALITLNDADETKVSGVVSLVGSTGTEESGVVVFPVTVQVKSVPGQTAAQLQTGMSADVTIYVSSTGKVLAIPESTVIDRQGQTFVRLLDPRNPKQPKLVQVTLGTRNGSYVEVLSGLEEGDQVLMRRTWTGSGQSSTKSNGQKTTRQNDGPPAGAMMPMGGGR